MGAEIHFSKYGWLLMSRDKCALLFFNPFTKVKFELPPTTSSFFTVCFTSPPTSSECFVFGIFTPTNNSQTEFGFIKFGDREWKSKWLVNGTHSFWPSNCPPLFHNEMYYCLDYKARNIREFDSTKEDEYRWIHFGKCHEAIEEEEEDEEEEEEEEDEDEEEEEDDGDANDEEIVHESYMVEVEGEIWGVFLRNNSGQVSVEKLNLSEMRWKKLESLGDKCLYLSTKGSFAETCVVSDMANKISFNKFDGKNGIMYCLSSGMYQSVVGNFASKEVVGNIASNEVYGPGLAQVDHGTWIKPSIYRGENDNYLELSSSTYSFFYKLNGSEELHILQLFFFLFLTYYLHSFYFKN